MIKLMNNLVNNAKINSSNVVYNNKVKNTDKFILLYPTGLSFYVNELANYLYTCGIKIQDITEHLTFKCMEILHQEFLDCSHTTRSMDTINDTIKNSQTVTTFITQMVGNNDIITLDVSKLNVIYLFDNYTKLFFTSDMNLYHLYKPLKIYEDSYHNIDTIKSFYEVKYNADIFESYFKDNDPKVIFNYLFGYTHRYKHYVKTLTTTMCNYSEFYNFLVNSCMYTVGKSKYDTGEGSIYIPINNDDWMETFLNDFRKKYKRGSC